MTTCDLSYYDVAMGLMRPPTNAELAAIEREACATAALEEGLNALARGDVDSTTVVALWRVVEDARHAVVMEVGT